MRELNPIFDKKLIPSIQKGTRYIKNVFHMFCHFGLTRPSMASHFATILLHTATIYWDPDLLQRGVVLGQCPKNTFVRNRMKFPDMHRSHLLQPLTHMGRSQESIPPFWLGIEWNVMFTPLPPMCVGVEVGKVALHEMPTFAQKSCLPLPPHRGVVTFQNCFLLGTEWNFKIWTDITLPNLHTYEIFLKIDLILHPIPLGMGFSKHDHSVHICTFHSIPTKKYSFGIWHHPCPMGVEAAKHDFLSRYGHFFQFSLKTFCYT